jgi:hypothetical protein
MATKKSGTNTTIRQPKVSHPGMMGDGTEEQNLNEEGDPSARIDRTEVEAAFGKKPKGGEK